MESTIRLIPLTLLKTHVYVPVPACLTEPRVDYICVNLETLPTKLMIFFALSILQQRLSEMCKHQPFLQIIATGLVPDLLIPNWRVQPYNDCQSSMWLCKEHGTLQVAVRIFVVAGKCQLSCF